MVPDDFRTPGQPTAGESESRVWKLRRMELLGRRPVGRPAKPALTDEEFAWACTILGEGRGGPRTGWRWTAKSISIHRGADRDPKAAVSVWWLRHQLEARGFCRSCWERGARDWQGNFQPGVCPKHFRGVQLMVEANQ